MARTASMLAALMKYPDVLYATVSDTILASCLADRSAMWPFSRLTLLVHCQTQLQLDVSNVYSTAFCFVMVHKHVPQQGLIKMSSSREEDTEA